MSDIINVKIKSSVAKICATCIHLNHEQMEEKQMADGLRKFYECNRMESDMGEPKDKNTMAYASDKESYWANVLVDPFFSCSMWEGGE